MDIRSRSKHAAGKLRTSLASEMRPLGEPQIHERARLVAGQRELAGIGHAIHPDAPGSEPLAEPDREKAGRGAGGDHHIWPELEKEPDDSERGATSGRSCSSGCRLRIDPEIGVVTDIRSIALVDRCIRDVAAFEGRSQAQQLDPVPAAGGNGQDLWDVSPSWCMRSRRPRTESTAGMVLRRILRSSHSDQFSMYSWSMLIHWSKETWFRPLICQMQVMPGFTESRLRNSHW